MADYIGYIAAILGTIAWIPQVVHTWKTKETKSLSLWTNLLILITVALWLVYGLITLALPLILANIAAVIMVGAIVLAKLIYK
ncbi:MAG: PQ-loop domain-containing transporter [Paracoccaceae bacterium]